MRRTRILRIVTRLNTGGPTVYLVTLSSALDLQRYEQWLVAGREGPGERSMGPLVEARGIMPIQVPEMAGTARLGPADLLALVRIRRLIRACRPDIVETHMSKAGILGRVAARLEGVPVVIHVFHGHVLHGYYGPVKTWLARRAERTCARMSTHLVAVSARVKDDLVRYRVAPCHRITVVEPGLDPGRWRDDREQSGGLRHELGIDPSAPLVGFVGRLTAIKNPGLFLDAAAIVLARRPEARFLIVGDGDLGPLIREEARRRHLIPHVIFAGWRDDLATIYGDLDLLVSCSNNEGCPLAIIEAMCTGCPVVATRVGGVPDLITDGVTGLIVPPRSPEPLAAAILRLLDDHRVGRALAQAARSAAGPRFAATRLARDMDGLYTRLLSHAARATPGISRSKRGAPASASRAMDVDKVARR